MEFPQSFMMSDDIQIEGKGLSEFINTSLKRKVKADNLELFHLKVKWILGNYWVMGKSKMCRNSFKGRAGRKISAHTYYTCAA